MHIATLFPPTIAYGAVGGPVFSTALTSLHNGGEKRQSLWQQARMEYRISQTMLTHTDIDPLLTLFYRCYGQAHSFCFHDWLDNKATEQPLGTGDDKTCYFPLSKRYQEYTRRIHCPIADSVIVMRNNRVEPSTHYYIDAANGMIQFNTPPHTGDVLMASFDFYVRVRFKSDTLPITLDSDKRFSVHTLELVESL